MIKSVTKQWFVWEPTTLIKSGPLFAAFVTRDGLKISSPLPTSAPRSSINMTTMTKHHLQFSPTSNPSTIQATFFAGLLTCPSSPHKAKLIPRVSQHTKKHLLKCTSSRSLTHNSAIL